VQLHTREITRHWQGFFGNFSGRIALSTSGENTFYNWSISSPSGELYASRTLGVHFPSINCSSSTGIEQEDIFLSSTGSPDSVNNTFNTTAPHPDFYTGTRYIGADSCPSTNAYMNSTRNVSVFHQVLLEDGNENTVYTTILQPDATGFDGTLKDFQLMVPTRSGIAETYYFWVEIN